MSKLSKIWSEVEKAFGNSNKKMCIVKKLLLYGIKIKNSNLYCGELKVTLSSLAEACNVDRRTVVKTISLIERDPLLRRVFEGIEPSGPFLYNIARLIGYRSLVIEVKKDKPGILASVSSVLTRHNLNIMQVRAEDPNLIPNAKLYIIVNKEIPGEIINEILRNPVIKKVTIS